MQGTAAALQCDACCSITDFVSQKSLGGGSGWFSTYQSKWAITRKFDEVLKKLQQEYQSELNSARISDRELQAIKLAFEAIRNPRNLIAHEHSYSPTWNEAGGLMHNFVLYFKLINQIIGVLLANPR